MDAKVIKTFDAGFELHNIMKRSDGGYVFTAEFRYYNFFPAARDVCILSIFC